MRWRSNSVKSIRDTEQEPNSPPTSGSPIVFSGWALHKTSFAQSLLYSDFKKCLEVFLTCCDWKSKLQREVGHHVTSVLVISAKIAIGVIEFGRSKIPCLIPFIDPSPIISDPKVKKD